MYHIDQQIQAWTQSASWPCEGFVQLALAEVAGGLVGLEREMRGRDAGFRTNLLVGMGSALVMLVSIHMVKGPWEAGGKYNINVDPARIAYGVMTGIGFLGAGAILKQKAGVRGLTTAAGLWCVAAIGLAMGAGMYTLGIFTTIVELIALWFLDYLEDVVPKRHHRRVTVRCPWEPGCVHRTVEWFEEANVSVTETTFARIGDLTHVDIYLSVAYTRRSRLDELVRRLEASPLHELIAMEENP